MEIFDGIYKIKIDCQHLGFFAAYRGVLEYMYFADRGNFYPYVDLSNSLYSNSGQNAFEQFFEQNDFHKDDNMRSVNSKPEDKDMVSFILTGRKNDYRVSDLYLREMAKMQKKYIVLKPEVQDFVDEGVKRIENLGKVLGIHVRGTDYNKGYHSHPIALKSEDYFEKIDWLVSNHSYNKIFLATDDERVLKSFKEKYGDLLFCFDDTCRSSMDESVAFSKNDRENHRIRLGLEVLRDAYAMAACDGFVSGISQVSICTRIIKYSLDKEFVDDEVIYKGININNKPFYKMISSSEDSEEEKKIKNARKDTFIMKCLDQWLKLKYEDVRLDEQLTSKGIKTIAVYGLGVLGKNLLRDLADSDITILYFIDRMKKDGGEVRILNLDDKFPKVDAVIVTPVIDTWDIICELKEKYDDQTLIIDIQDLLFEV